MAPLGTGVCSCARLVASELAPSSTNANSASSFKEFFSSALVEVLVLKVYREALSGAIEDRNERRDFDESILDIDALCRTTELRQALQTKPDDTVRERDIVMWLRRN